MAPKTADDDAPFLFDWETETPDRSIRLCQTPGPDDMALMEQKQRKSVLTLERTTILRIPAAFSQRSGPRSAGLERTIARASEGPDSRPDLAHRHTVSAAPISNINIPMVPSDELLKPRPRSSVQKILKLTGNMSTTTIPSTDTPSLHSSKQKIRQLTGLDLGPKKKADSLDGDASCIASEAFSSQYKYDASEDSHHDAPKDPHDRPSENSSYTRAESSCSNSYADSINEMRELYTPLTAPRFSTSLPALPSSRRDSNPHIDSSPPPVAKTLPLSGPIAPDVGLTTPGDTTPIPDGDESWLEPQSDEDLHSSTSSAISESEFQLEPTARQLYHDTAVVIATRRTDLSHNTRGSTAGMPSPPSKLQKMGFDSEYQASATDLVPPSRGSARGSISFTINPTHSSSAPASSRHAPRNPFRKASKEKIPLSERRGRMPSPLDAVATASYSTGRKQHYYQRTPYPPVSSSIRATVEEAAAEDGQARFSLLSRIFTGNSSSGGSGSSVAGMHGMGERGSVASGISSSGSGRTASVASASASAMTWASDMTTATASAWSPDTPSPASTSFGSRESRRSSVGLLARTMDHARNKTGRNKKAGKADKAEKARTKLRGKIKVLRDGNEPVAGSGNGSSLETGN
ncbi:unnamed protein product [Discula destructiva]